MIFILLNVRPPTVFHEYSDRLHRFVQSRYKYYNTLL